MLPHGSHLFRWMAPIGVAWSSRARILRAAPPPAWSAPSNTSPTDDTTAATHALEQSGAIDGNDPASACMLAGSIASAAPSPAAFVRSWFSNRTRPLPRQPGGIDGARADLLRAGLLPGRGSHLAQRARARSRRCDARRLLGLYHYQNWKRMNEYGDDLSAARRELRVAVACDLERRQCRNAILIAGYAQGDSIGAECDRFIARFPERAEFRMMRGTIAFEAKRYAACARDYAAAIELMDHRDPGRIRIPQTRAGGARRRALPSRDRRRARGLPARHVVSGGPGSHHGGEPTRARAYRTGSSSRTACTQMGPPASAAGRRTAARRSCASDGRSKSTTPWAAGS